MNIVGYNDNPVHSRTSAICRFYQKGMCRFGNRCRNIHGELDHMRISPKGKTPEKKNESTSLGKRPSTSSPKATPFSENSIEKAAVNESGPSTSSTASEQDDTQSSNKTCGICFDAIVEKKDKRDQVFGILPNCCHCFCFSCIRKWRQSKEFDFDVSKACPECRVASSYVYPSKIWFDIKDDKESFISSENSRMQKFHCKYFKKGSGTCPFGNTCRYLHALPNGKKIDIGPPRPRKSRTVSVIDHELAHQILYWLNDDDDELNLDDDDDDDDVDVDDNEFELDLDDPTIAMQYYDHDDIRRYIAIDRLMNPNLDSDDEEFFPLYL